MDPKNEIDPYLFSKLNQLKILKNARDPEKAAAGRASFLRESAEIRQTVSQRQIPRHMNWNQKLNKKFMLRKKERVPMLSTITSIIIAVSILLGGSGLTVAAAQSSLPGEVLYEIKLLSENTALDLTTNPESQFELAIDLMDRRATEIQDLLLSGELLSEEIQNNYRTQIEQAIVLALNLPQDQVVQAFEEIQARLQIQEELFAQIQMNGSEAVSAALTQTRQTIQERMQILENGQTNMLQIMEQQQIQEQNGNPGQQNGSQSSQETQSTPGTGNGNPWTTGTPTPGSSYGEGESNNPWTTGTPTPGSGYGIGNGTGTGTCTSTHVPPQNSQGGNNQVSATPKNGNSGGSGNH